MTDAPASRDEPAADRLSVGRFTDVRRFAELDSTNRYLLEAARAGAPEGMVAVADHQTAGRGRLGRTWESAPGAALLVSVLLRPAVTCPDLVPDRLQVVVAACSLAARDAIRRVAGVRAGLKWPNDLVVGDRKLGGVLAEAMASGGVVDALVVGLGLNVRADAFPAELADAATSVEVEAGGGAVDREALLEALLADLERRCGALREARGAAEVLADYREACVTLGRRVRVELADGVVEGVAVGVDDAGTLRVERSGSVTTVLAGDVVHLRPATGGAPLS